MNMEMTISHDFTFEAAHHLPNTDADHKCHRMHGHSYLVTVHVTGDIDPATGWIIEFHDLRMIVMHHLEVLDHHVLNEVPGLENPTVENVTRWLFSTLHDDLPNIVSVRVSETSDSAATYRCIT